MDFTSLVAALKAQQEVGCGVPCLSVTQLTTIPCVQDFQVLVEQKGDDELATMMTSIKGCPYIMSANLGGFQNPPPHLVSNCQHLHSPSPLVSNLQYLLDSPSPLVQQIALLCLLYLYVDKAGSGDPLYVAELCNWHSYGQRRSIRPIFFVQKRHFTYKQSVKKQKTGQKTGKNPSKKVFFQHLRPAG